MSESNSSTVTVLGFNGPSGVEGVENVFAALVQAGYSGDVSVRLNGESVPQDQLADTPVEPGDTVVAAAPELKGGSLTA